MESIHDFYNQMEKANVMLSFKGEVTSDLLTSILQIMESKMETLEEPPRIKKKVYNILVECLQNLYHHLDDDDFKTKINEKSAIIKCDYVIKSERGNKLLQKMITFRLNWLRIYKPNIKKVTANTTQMATNSHLKCGAKLIKKYKNNITKVQYEIL